MQLPRVRFTVRQMMIAIAIVGVAGGLEATRRRRESFRSRVLYHAGELQGIADENAPWNAAYWERFWFCPEYEDQCEWPQPSAIEMEAYRENREQRIAYHEAMYWKYKHAANRPWLPVEPDLRAPPEP